MASAGSIHRAMFRAVEDRDMAALRGLYHADYVYVAGDGHEQKGAEAGIAVAETYTTAFPDLAFTIQHHWEPREDVSIIELRATGTHEAELEGVPATGRRVEMTGCNVIEVADGKILREREYFDTATILQQLGVLDG